MLRWRRRDLVLSLGSAIAAAMLLALIAATALAITRIPTSTTITFINRELHGDPTDFFLGQISSPKHRCVAGRTVRLYREAGSDDPLLGSGRSGEDGFWKVLEEDPPGMRFYYVKVARKRFEVDGDARVCKAARSGDLPVEPN